ncbi:MAG: 5-oxoprolinase subunit B family protein [Gemmobacter sp.]
MTGPRFLDAGECALTVEFGAVIDDALAARVLALDAALAADPLPGMAETVPTYRSLMIHYDPLVLPRAGLVSHIRAALARPATGAGTGALWHLPACYDPAMADDLGHIADACAMPPDRVTAAHVGATYRVVMYGFAPGWAYLSGLPRALTLPRRASPRDRIPAGSLIVAGGQAIVAALPMPSGWHILGRTPVRLFDPARDPAFLVAPGDRLRFDPVDAATFAALDVRAAAGEVLARKSP